MNRKTQNLSKLITQNQYQSLQRKVGERRQILANTIAEVYLTKQPNHNYWVHKTTGILCFVKDFSARSYFFEVFDLDTYTKLWSEELYLNLEYSEATSFLHIFEGVHYNVGFNFSDEDEAKYFATCVQNLTKRRSNARDLSNKPREIEVVPVQNIVIRNKICTPNSTLLNKKKTFRKKELKKLVIGKPQDFKHMAHMASKSSEEAFNYNPELMALFNKVGITERQLRDPATKSILDQVVLEKSEQIDKILKKAAPQPKQNNIHILHLESAAPQSNLKNRKSNIRPLPVRTPPISTPVISDIENNSSNCNDNFHTNIENTPALPTPPPFEDFENFCRERANNTISKKPQAIVQPSAASGTTDLMDAIRKAIDVRYLAIQRDDDTDDEWDA